jgi:acyl-CoA thioesterase II
MIQEEENLVQDLIDLVNVERIDENLFCGSIAKNAYGNVFGGQVIAQGLMAACKTIENDALVHSLHAYFLRPGNIKIPIDYKITQTRNGKSFATREISAIQNNKEILKMICSFTQDEQGYEHQAIMPQISAPLNHISREQYLRENIDKYPEEIRPYLLRPRPIEFREANEIARKDVKNYWFKSISSVPDDKILNRVLLAYISDFTFLGTCLSPHDKNWFDNDIQVASLDHAIWFHNDSKIDDWLLYSQDSPWAGGGRGFNRGMIFNQSGKLIASCSQEALIRKKP